MHSGPLCAPRFTIADVYYLKPSPNLGDPRIGVVPASAVGLKKQPRGAKPYRRPQTPT